MAKCHIDGVGVTPEKDENACQDILLIRLIIRMILHRKQSLREMSTAWIDFLASPARP